MSTALIPRSVYDRLSPEQQSLVGQHRVDNIEQHRPSLFSMICERRGWTPDYIEAINEPSYDELKDINEMVSRLHRVRMAGEKIVVLPDFDMDGITSGVLGWAGLAELGFDVELYVPDYRRGHDVTRAAVQELHERYPTATTVITCDGGVNSHEGMKRGKDLGLTMLVTDHHVQLEDDSPADVIVDPERRDETYAHPGICGAFVLYQVLMAYARAHARHKIDDIRMLRLFAGIGTVSDVMPLLYENRDLVRDSLSMLRMLWVPIPREDLVTEYDPEKSLLMILLRADQSHAPQYVSAFEGLAVCLQAFREQGKLRSGDDLDEGFYGFYLAPTFNSIRRIEGEMADAFGTFTEPTRAHKLERIKRVIEGNELRKELTIEHMAKLEEGEQPLAPWVWLTEAPTGMLGLMASKIMERTGFPVVVVRDEPDPGKRRGGSARSPVWFPIISTMTHAGFTAVGHENACGVRMGNAEELELFAAYMAQEATRIHDELQSDGTWLESQRADLVLGHRPECDGSLDDLDDLVDLALALDRMRPFGHGFAQPAFDLVVDLSRCSIEPLGEEEKHIKVVTRSGLRMLWWNSAEHLARLKEIASNPIPGRASVTFRAELRHRVFMGHERVEAQIEEMVQAPDENDGGWGDDWGDS